MEDKLLQLYAVIPRSKCKEGCFKCCINMIQLTETEKRNIGGYEYNGACPHLTDGKCTVYEKRPLVCRIYGTSELLMCKDCIATELLSKEDTLRIMREYTLMLKKEKI